MNFLFRNASWQFLNTVITICFPLAVFPYVSRLFGPANLGVLNYVDSCVQFLLFVTTLGLQVYGAREIAYQKDRISQSRTLYQLIFIHSILILIAIAGLSLYDHFTEKMGDELFVLAVANLAIHPLLAEWYFQGRQKFSLLLARNFIIRLLLLTTIFLLVTRREDIVLYYGLFTVAQFGTALWSITAFTKETSFRLQYFRDALRHVRPLMFLFLTMGGISVFIYFDIIILGNLRTAEETGIYSAGIKVIRVLTFLFSACLPILLPALAAHVANSNKEAVNAVVSKSLQLLLYIGLPATISLYILAEPVIRLLAGPDYLAATRVVQICAPLPLIISLSNLLGIQFLVAVNKVSVMLKIVAIGCVIGIPLLIYLTANYSYHGTATATLITECVVFILCALFSAKHLVITWPRNFAWGMLFVTVASSLLVYYINFTLVRDIIKITIAAAGTGIVLVMGLYFFRIPLLGDNPGWFSNPPGKKA